MSVRLDRHAARSENFVPDTDVMNGRIAVLPREGRQKTQNQPRAAISRASSRLVSRRPELDMRQEGWWAGRAGRAGQTDGTGGQVGLVRQVGPVKRVGPIGTGDAA